MSIYEQMCRERRWLDHRTPLPLGQVMPPPRKEKFCTWYTGLMTECGDPATQLRDGLPHCDFHAGTHDALVRAEKMLEELELADDEVQDEHGWIHRPGQMPRKGDM